MIEAYSLLPAAHSQQQGFSPLPGEWPRNASAPHRARRRGSILIRLLLALLLPAAFAPPAVAQEEEEDLEGALMNIEELEGEERAAALRELCRSSDSDAAAALVTVLLRPKPEDTEEMQEKVFQKLLSLRSREILPELKKAIEGEEAQPKVYAVRLIARALGPESFRLVRQQLDSESLVRTAAIKAVGDCGHPDAPALLRQLLADPKTTGDDLVFIRMSLVKLGDSAELPHLLADYQRIVSEALQLEDLAKYLDTPAAKARNSSRIRFLWQLEKELRTYFGELPDAMIPVLVNTLETTASEEGVQLVFDLLPRLMTPERCPTFALMLESRFIGLRQLALYYFFKWDRPELKQEALASLRKHLASSNWRDRRMALMYSAFFPDAQRWPMLEAAARDPVLWVRIEAVRELGRWGTAQALQLIDAISTETSDEQLRFTCRVARAGLSEDLHGLR
ncbi:MAG: HEAT repeat domain-containing protein [Planctomycetes bacterium]|nr:HEAT repeat domain-containing protein [Planctomycetota bacterium]